MQRIIILDFGSQTTQLIGRRVREMNTFCEILPYDRYPEDDGDVIGVILSGSPLSVYAEDAARPSLGAFLGRKPVLGICYGAQLLSFSQGGRVEPVGSREYGRAELSFIDASCPLFKGIEAPSQVWMSHGDTITALPEGYRVTASTDSVEFAAFQSASDPVWGVQFHPEVMHTLQGARLLENFVVGICGSRREWTPDSFVESSVQELRAMLGEDKVVLGLSGGVDSSVAAVLLHRAIGDRLNCIFVNHGLLRKNEFEDVLKDYEGLGLNVKGVDASKEFMEALAGESDPERKRKIIGGKFVEVFNAQASRIEGARWLAQGTIYPDRIESSNISLGMPRHMVYRHPFPGPGLAVRILEDITPEKVRILQDVDDIFMRGLREYGLYDRIWQAGAILLPVRTVGVMGDERTYDRAVVLRAVTSTDAMTADWAELPTDFLRAVSNDIINNVKGVNRVCYDISSKPPATIEWE